VTVNPQIIRCPYEEKGSSVVWYCGERISEEPKIKLGVSKQDDVSIPQTMPKLPIFKIKTGKEFGTHTDKKTRQETGIQTRLPRISEPQKKKLSIDIPENIEIHNREFNPTPGFYTPKSIPPDHLALQNSDDLSKQTV